MATASCTEAATRGSSPGTSARPTNRWVAGNANQKEHVNFVVNLCHFNLERCCNVFVPRQASTCWCKNDHCNGSQATQAAAVVIFLTTMMVPALASVIA